MKTYKIKHSVLGSDFKESFNLIEVMTCESNIAAFIQLKEAIRSGKISKLGISYDFEIFDYLIMVRKHDEKINQIGIFKNNENILMDFFDNRISKMYKASA